MIHVPSHSGSMLQDDPAGTARLRDLRELCLRRLDAPRKIFQTGLTALDALVFKGNDGRFYRLNPTTAGPEVLADDTLTTATSRRSQPISCQISSGSGSLMTMCEVMGITWRCSLRRRDMYASPASTMARRARTSPRSVISRGRLPPS